MLTKIKNVFLILIISPLLILAQPRGDEHIRIRQLVLSVQGEILDVDEKIAKNQNNANLHAERGKLYVKLYRTLYLTSYLSSFYGQISEELSLNSVSAKAIEDFNKAIKAKPNAELLKLRGEMYALRWFIYSKSFDWGDEVRKLWFKNIKKIGGEEWWDILDDIQEHSSRRKEELAVLQKFLGHNDFDQARKDFEKAIKINANSDLTEAINENLGRLLITRAAQLRIQLVGYDHFNYSSLDWNDLTSPNQSGYSIWDDLNQGILHIKNGNIENREGDDIICCNGYTAMDWEKLPTLKEALFLKAIMAFNLVEDKIALETLNEIEKLLDQKPIDNFACELYSLRSGIHSRMKNFDAALADANKTSYDSDHKSLCGSAYEPRGDAYFGKGNFREAFADYYSQLAQLRYGSPLNVDITAIYKKLGTAFLKLKDRKSEFNFATWDHTYQFHTYVEDAKLSIELLKIRSQIYRQIGEEKKALEDESRLEFEITRLKHYESQRSVYGKVSIPDNSNLKAEDISVEAVFDKNANLSPLGSNYCELDKRGRFYLENLINEPFQLYVYFDTIEKGVSVRYYWESQKFERGNKIFGPIIIELNRFNRKIAQ